MIRKLLLGLVVLLILAAIGFFGFGPGIVERGMNKVVPTTLPTVTAQTQALHNQLQVVDLHGDTLLWKRHLDQPAGRGQIDLPRLLAGNVALQIFSSVTKTPRGQNYGANGSDTDNIALLAFGQLQPVRTWTSLLQRSRMVRARLVPRMARTTAPATTAAGTPPNPAPTRPPK